MKLYVWRDILRDYTSGIAFAIAENAEQARALISLGWQSRPSEIVPDVDTVGGAWKATPRSLSSYQGDLEILGDLANPPEEYELDSPVGFGIYGGG